MSALRSYALTAGLTGAAVVVMIGLRYGGSWPAQTEEVALAAMVVDPVTTGSVPRRPAVEAAQRPRRFAPSAFTAGEITVPVPTVQTETLRFSKDGVADGPEAGRFSAPNDAGPTVRARTRLAGLDPIAATGAVEAAPSAPPTPRETMLSRVAVIDGRTLSAGGLRIRLAGIDLLPAGQACPLLDGTAETCRNRARTQLELFLRHRPVACALPPERTGGTITARCRLGGVDLSEWLVRSGWALGGADAHPGLAKAAAEAKRRRLGAFRTS